MRLLIRSGSVAELVDALDSKSSSAMSVGSIPTRATRNKNNTQMGVVFISACGSRNRTAVRNAAQRSERGPRTT